MNRSIKWAVALMVVSTSVVIAEIAVDFKADSRFEKGERLPIKGSLVLDFTIDHSGQVVLDASAGKKSAMNIRKIVNRWDGVVGTVKDPSLFNTSFSFAVNGWRRNDEGSLYEYQDINIYGNGPGYLGINGQDPGAIDGASSPHKNHEMFVWTLTTSTDDLDVEVTAFDWGGKNDMKRSMLLFDHDTTNSWYGQPSAGFMNLSGYVIGNGEQMTFSIPVDGKCGYGFSGFTLEVVPSPEAASLSALLASQKPTKIGLLIY